ncbi:hypothetical protein HS088_TW08G00581 [Tripterygium wilfordii]|uniref:Uncharacterized protein n=1 Tax=Tripterygium wilfordii TaxID=458696 RepID=A0A7J7DCD9_TRIWF|nr:hypothetical protein HS088_TW08G00581 [Tripterygium wilfordii]
MTLTLPEYRVKVDKIDWKALVEATQTIGYSELQEDASESTALEYEDFLKKFHYALLELHLEGLIYPQTGCKLIVTEKIRNMLLHDDEI